MEKRVVMDYNSIAFKNAAVDRLSKMTTDPALITRNRAKAARDMRKDVIPMQNADGTTSTHVMAGGEGGSGKFKYTVNPTVFPNDGGKTWTDLREDPWGAYDEASKRGELIGFKSERRAEKFGMGSWKKGQAGREAMQMYREEKKAGNLYTQKKKVENKIANIDNNKRLNRVVDRRYERMDKKYDRAANNPAKLSKLDKKYGYNYEAAKAAGIQPDETGHWGSIGNDGMILKGPKHPSMIKTKKVEGLLGNKIVKRNGNLYSVPKK
jgi:hypothetical protein